MLWCTWKTLPQVTSWRCSMSTTRTLLTLSVGDASNNCVPPALHRASPNASVHCGWSSNGPKTTVACRARRSSAFSRYRWLVAPANNVCDARSTTRCWSGPSAMNSWRPPPARYRHVADRTTSVTRLNVMFWITYLSTTTDRYWSE